MVNEHVSVKQVKDLMGGVEALQDKVGQIGEVVTPTEITNSMESGVWTGIRSLVLTKGLWLAYYRVGFTASSIGIRELAISNTKDSQYNRIEIKNAVNGDVTLLSGFYPISVASDNETWYLNGYQNYGNTLTANITFMAYRLS